MFRHYMFQPNSTVKQTETLCGLSFVHGEFSARKPMWPHVFFRPFSGLKVNTRVFQEISVCAILFFC